MSLADIRYESGRMVTGSQRRRREPESSLRGYLEDARRLLGEPVVAPDGRGVVASARGEDFEALRWFWLPEEIAAGAP